MRFKTIILCITFNLLFIYQFSSAQNSEIYGKVVDSTTKEGIADATVILFPSGVQTKTKANGNFFLEGQIKPGSFIQIMKSGYEGLKIKGNLTEVYAELRLLTAVEGQNVIIEGKRDRKKVIVSRQKVDNEMIKRSTSNLFDDSIQVIKTMPGVVSVHDFSALMYVRGGEFYETANYLNQHLVFNPYFWGGAVSIFNPNMVKSIDFYSGAFPAEYGLAMSGVVDVTMKDGNTKKFGGFAELSMTTLSTFFEGPLGEPGKTSSSFMIGVRRTHYDLVMNQVSNSKGAEFPYFYDAQMYFKLQLDNKNILRLESTFVHEGMDIKFEDVSDDEDSTAGWKKGNEFKYKSYSFMQGASLTSILSNKLLLQNSASYEYRYGTMKYKDRDSPVDIDQTYQSAQLRNDLTYKPNKSHIIKAGIFNYIMWMSTDLNATISGIPADFDPILAGFGGGPGTSEANAYTFTASQIPTDSYSWNWKGKTLFLPAFYLQDDIELLKNTLYLNIGARAQYFNITKRYTIDPRIGFKLRASKKLDFKLAGGIYSSYPTDGENTRFLSEEDGNTDLDFEKSYHVVLGSEYTLKNFFFRLDTFGKYYNNILTEDYKYNFVNGTIGYAYGFDLFIQKKPKSIFKNWYDRIDGWIAYSFIITRRKITDRTSVEDYNAGVSNSTDLKGDYEIPYNTWYKPLQDKPHTLNIILNYTFAKKWRLSTTTKIGSGALYTPVTGRTVYLNTSNNEYYYSPSYGDYNSSRTSFYFKIDLKLSMPFFWNNWSSFIQVINLLNRDNVQSVYYDETYTKKRDSTGLPRLIIFGIRAEF